VGCTAFLTKPIDMDKLVESLSEVLACNGFESEAAGAFPTAASNEQRVHERVPIHSSLPTGDLEFCEIIAEFEERLREKLQAIHAASAQREYDELAQLAHWLKGSGGMAGFHQFTEPARELERLAHAGIEDHAIAAIVDEIQGIADCIVVPELAAHPSS
jgi:HPt (histidine-containing phosphotransfer) domain-containing protein